MKDIKYFPFDRNRYFYGKLLSVDDFETEQKYNNNKRRMINRFVLGTGVVCGMNVVVVDDSTVSVEKGLALDFSGREIVIEAPVTKKLAMIDGFDNYNELDQKNYHLYLCVEYDESEKEPVHSIANAKVRGTDQVEYNKLTEGYHLYLTAEEPEADNMIESFYEDAKVIYWGNKIRVKQVLPKYIESNTTAEMKIIVENHGLTKPFSFSYELDLTCLSPVNKKTAKISFDERNYEKAAKYELSYPLRTIAVKGQEGSVAVREGSFELIIDGKKSKANAKGTNNVYITEGNTIKQIIADYYQNAMEDILKNNYQQGIYLAKIYVIKAGSSYVIDSLEPMPFNQYVFSNPLAAVLNNMLLSRKDEKAKADRADGSRAGDSGSLSGLQKIATGTTIINLGIGADAGQKFYSEELTHGLGLGNVNITLGLSAGADDDNSVVYGAQDLFADNDEAIRAELAAKVDISRGTFVIGLKCQKATDKTKVKVHWMAVKDNSGVINDNKQNSMNIKPDIVNLTTNETYYFEAVVADETISNVKWFVKEENGGTIDDNGMYVAPNKAGVYEIIAESTDNNQMRASAFVVVREA